MSWITETLKSPEFLLMVLTAMTGLLGLSLRGVKAQFSDEFSRLIDAKFEAHERVETAHDETVNIAIAALKGDVDDLKRDVHDVKVDVRSMSDDIKKILSNGFLRGH